MCRFIAYIGSPLIINDVLFKPKHSLIKQSVNAQEMKEPLNGDGFGLGWYAKDIDAAPALFRSIQPAWNDINLQYLAEKVRSTCFLAHIRSASVGGVSQFNCHPFHYENLLFMHNGKIENFKKIKRYIRRSLNDDIYNWIQGSTDSEHFFAMFLDRLIKSKLIFDANNAAHIVRETIQELEKIKQLHGVSESSALNVVITDGNCMIATRYISNPNEHANTLYYAAGERYDYHHDKCHILPSQDGSNGAVLLVSERLTSYKADWHEISANHILQVSDNRSIVIEPI